MCPQPDWVLIAAGDSEKDVGVSQTQVSPALAVTSTATLPTWLFSIIELE